jgi:catechol 2,3-dioxygenase-like lactoylglutathione lyase family enzyme
LWPDTDLRVCYDCIDWMNGQRELQIAREGGPVQVLGHEPIFGVADLARAVAHYDRLGWKIEHHDESYAFARLGTVTLHLAQNGDAGDRIAGSVYLHVDDADRLASTWRESGLVVVGPRNEDYGKREGRHIDPDGNSIRFGSPIPPA